MTVVICDLQAEVKYILCIDGSSVMHDLCAVCVRVWRQWLPGGLSSHELGLFLREWLCQRSFWTGQAAHRRRQQMVVQKQGPW